MRFAIAACVVLMCAGASATTDRFALVVANHEGGAGLPRLRYPQRDAERLTDVLVDLGSFSRADILTVVDGGADDVMGTLREAERRIKDAKRAGNEVVFLFYYSGHAQNGLLRLGDTTLDMALVKQSLEASSADVRLAFIDSCGAGAMIRAKGDVKGGQMAPPFVVAVDQALSAKGQVIVTSSAADEVSQESDDIQGSFFTHYLSTGLRGDADRNHDGRVTLDEAYGYAFGRTVAATAQTRAGAQHPTYSYDLQGAGDVTLTEPGGADVRINFPAELKGRYFVVDLDRQLFVAEIDKDRGERSFVALPKGKYAVKKRTDSHLLIANVEARTKGVFEIDEASMQQVAFADDYAKGTPVVTQDLQWRDVRLSVSLGVGVHGVLDSVTNGNLFPTTPMLVLEVRAHNLLRAHLLSAVDLDLGSVQSERVIDAGALGAVRYPIQHTVVQGGVALLWEQKLLGDWLLLAGGGRVAGLWFHAAFLGDAAPLAQQNYLAFSPGLVGIVGVNPTNFFHVELVARAQWLPYNVDALRNLAVVEGLASAWFDF